MPTAVITRVAALEICYDHAMTATSRDRTQGSARRHTPDPLHHRNEARVAASTGCATSTAFLGPPRVRRAARDQRKMATEVFHTFVIGVYFPAARRLARRSLRQVRATVQRGLQPAWATRRNPYNRIGFYLGLGLIAPSRAGSSRWSPVHGRSVDARTGAWRRSRSTRSPASTQFLRGVVHVRGR